MRRTLALLGMLAACSPFACAQGKTAQLYTATREQLDVTKIVLAQENAWNRGDMNGYLAEYKDAEDTVAILNSPVRGLSSIRSAYRSTFPNKEAMGTLEQSDVEVRELGTNFALATGHYKLLRSKKSGGDAEGSFTEIFEKTEAGWKLIFSETT